MSFERPNGPTFFGDKDTLPTGNGDKVIKGSEVDADFNAISTELNSIRNDMVQAGDGIVDINEGQADGEVLKWVSSASEWVNTNTLNVGFDSVTIEGTVISKDPASKSVTFIADKDRVEIGVRSFATNTFINGDVFLGMSANFLGVDLPVNNDVKPGNTFCGGMVMTGSYINGQSLYPIYNGETEEQIMDRAFSKDAALNMNGNLLFGLKNATLDDEAMNLGYMRAHFRKCIEAAKSSNSFDEFKAAMIAVYEAEQGE